MTSKLVSALALTLDAGCRQERHGATYVERRADEQQRQHGDARINEREQHKCADHGRRQRRLHRHRRDEEGDEAAHGEREADVGVRRRNQPKEGLSGR